MKNLIGVILFLIIPALASAQGKYTISGYVSDNQGEELIGANVTITNLDKGTVTNTYGFYSITLPPGKYKLEFSFIGYTAQDFNIDLKADKKLDVKLKESSQMIESVQVSAEKRDVNVRKVEMSTNRLEMKTIDKLPRLFGETDILKTITLLPGVMQASEASGGFNVRGGSTDQNLILLDDAPVYNASHMAGFFSVFNTDAIKDLKLYKGGIPAQYGGRLASILDIHMKEGNKNEFHGAGGIGVISSRLTLEGPIVPGKISFLLAGRRTYADLFLPFAKDSTAKKSDLYFYDLNAKINYSINDNNRIFLSGYFGRDVVKLANTLNMDYGNATLTFRWNHVFNKRLFMDASTIYSNYRWELGVKEGVSNINWITGITDKDQHLDFTLYANPENTIKFGIQGIAHTFRPGKLGGQFNDSTKFDYMIPNTHSIETGIYISNEQQITSRLSMIYGLRYSFFLNAGPGQSLVFDKTDPQNYVVTDTLHYGRGDIFHSYMNGFAPRLSLRYIVGKTSSIKASYNRMYQYVQLASNSTASLPIDFWFPASPNIKPQRADQVALGYFRNFKDNMLETSVEVYYKTMKNTVDFRDHANLILNANYEAEIRTGTGYSYGVEFLVRKQIGKLTGWASYTYSRTFKKIPAINKGKTYPASYDKPNDITLVLSYDVTDRLNIAGNWIFNSAPPRTMPTGRFEYGGGIGPVYSDRNSIRIFPYHRLDLSVTWRLNKIKKKNFENFLNFSVYNAYMRKNPLQISFEQDPDHPYVTKAVMVYLYRIVPSISYNFNF